MILLVFYGLPWDDFWLCLWFCVLLHTTFIVVYLSTYTTHFAICKALFLRVVLFYSICSSLLLSFPLYFPCAVYFHSSLASAYLLLNQSLLHHLCFPNTAFCHIYASTSVPKLTTCSLLTSLVYFSTTNPLSISAVMASIIYAIDDLLIQPPVIFLKFMICSLYL